MRRFFEQIRHLSLLGVFSLLIASGAAFVWGGIKTVSLLVMLFSSWGKDPGLVIQFILIFDAFLIATTLLIFSLSLYELFVAPLESVPEWLIVRSLSDLKGKLSSMIVLVMGVRFLETLLEHSSPDELLKVGIAISMVSAVLVAYGHFSHRE